MFFFILFGIKFVDGAKIRKATSSAAFLLSQMFSHLCNSAVNTRSQAQLDDSSSYASSSISTFCMLIFPSAVIVIESGIYKSVCG
ncbi:hypothetical protein FMN12_19735 [Bacteroides acidifaciens]|uniref:Uncharacterized protein n=1 Tax=Bacteroides acidifaciens TaxID=85831 RepID=A0A3L7Z4A8_9BACE|nr:hypothetical protein [Bacteroides acidifaciens]RLT81124.1 hypothetical protein D7Y07_04780 [Bacteroides acidifaciens]TFU52706.1 hypothetical protein E4T97_01235 [Bacteroides acidifaciens]TGY06802.1 hypothetical protein E5356_05765 [Bacteroides acidifaciens]